MPNNPILAFLTGMCCFTRSEYGEGQANDVALNLRTRAFRSYDNAGIVNSEEYDFKGNLLRGTRQLAADYKGIPDWAATVDLEPEVFANSTTYDALNRPISLVSPDNSEIKPTYNEANLLEQVQVRLRGAAEWTSFVADIDYNAKGQRELIEYGNGVQTTYDYDPLTFRLINLKTTRDSDGDLQNLSYTFDPAGNITYIKDAAQQTIFFANTQITPDADYIYDAIYQLIQASGREHIGQMGQVDHNDPDIHPLPHPNNVEAMRLYTESLRIRRGGQHSCYDPPGQRRELDAVLSICRRQQSLTHDQPARRRSQRTLHRGVQIQSTRQHDIHAASGADGMGLCRAPASVIGASVQRRHG